QSVINLSTLGVNANSNIQFRFELGTDGCNGNDGWYIDEIVIYNCTAILSVSESNLLQTSIKVFPNPSNGILTIIKQLPIELKSAENVDINGRVIKSYDLSTMQNEMKIDISSFSTGIYFISITSNTAKSVIKLIKQ